MPATAAPRSASSKTTAAPFPPSSISWRFIPRPQTPAIRRPTAVEPVKLTMSTSGESTAASPTSGPEPVTTFTTPGGTPAASRASAMRRTESGSCGAGFTTTVLPMARAGAILPAGLAQGLLYEVTQVTTPTGWRTARAPITAALPKGPASLIWGAIGSSTGSTRAYRWKRAAPTPTCMPRAVPVVAPLSACARSAYGTRWRRMWSAVRARIAARSAAGVLDHGPKASRAAAAAACTCSREASGAHPTTSSVAGSTTG